MRWLSIHVVLALAFAAIALAGEASSIRISAAEARAKKLPAATIELSVKGLGMTVSKLPDAATYLRLSGPPGGPLGMVLRPFTGIADGEATRALANREVEKPFSLAAPEEVRLGKLRLWGIAYASASGQARAQGCLLLQPSAKARRGVSIRFWTAAGRSGAVTCKAVLGIAPFPRIFRSLKVVVE